MASAAGPPVRPAALDASNIGPLTLDGLYEVLLRLPAKELCRLRAVYRPWRSLLSEASFAAKHAARHRETLFLVSYAADRSAEHDGLVDVLDASGRVLKWVHRNQGQVVVGMASDLVCVMLEGGTFQLMNLSTGSVYQLPNKLPEEHLAPEFRICHYGEPVHVFGKVASTGE